MKAFATRCCSAPLLTTVVLLLLQLCSPPRSIAQRETSIWYFGNLAGLNFNVPPATLVTPSEVTTSVMSASEGSAVECDRATGQILFYTNGIQVFDRTNTPMANATGANQLGGNTSSTQPALSVPDPGNANRYFLFTTLQEGGGGAEFSIVDMTLNGGLGDVSAAAHRLPLPTLGGNAPPAIAAEKIAATRDAAGIGYWIVFHELTNAAAGSNRFYAYHLSNAGLDAVMISSAGTPIVHSAGGGSNVNARGEMKLSPDGKWLATANEDQVSELFRFDNATGAVTVAVTLDLGQQHYGLSFSPNSQLLYINTGWKSGNQIFQYNLSNPAPATILGSKVQIGLSSGGGLSAMQIAPDGRIYMARDGSQSLGVINCPNVPGAGSTYIDNGFTLTGARRNNFGLPNIVLESVATPQFAGRDTAICAGVSVKIGVPARPGFTYSWTPAAELDDPASATPLATPTATTPYRVIVTNPFGCHDTAFATVTVNPLPTIVKSADTVICAGASIQLTASGGATYNWSPGTGLSNANIPNPVASPLATTTYTVTATSATNCSSSATVQITVNPKPSVTASASVAICPGDTVQLTSSASPGVTFRWEPPGGLDNATIGNPRASPTATTPYMVIATNSSGCSDTSRVTVTVNPKPTASVSAAAIVLCEGDQRQLTASGGTTYNWSPATGLSNPNIPNPIASPTVTTNYKVIVGNASGCIDSARVNVTVNPKPVVVLAATDSICAGRGKMITASGGTIYRWSPATGLSDPNIPNPIVSPTASTTYKVVVENANGCRDSANISVVVITPSARIALPDTAADPHQHDFHIPFTLAQVAQLTECAPDSFTVEIEFNASLFFPKSVTRGAITKNTLVAGRRIVAITLPGNTPLASPGIITELIGDVLLGDSTTTPLHIRSIGWNGLIVKTDSVDGRLQLLPICTSGGARLLDFGNGFGITKIVPNPGSGNVTVNVLTVELGTTALELYSISGARLFAVTWEPAGESGGDMREITLPADLPSGLYRVVLRTPARHDAKSLIITK